jgi:hypothetical protein
MPSFAIDGYADLAEFLIPVTDDMARQIVTAALASETGYASAAVYYKTGNRDNPRSASIRIGVSTEDGYMYVITGDYRPRKDGKADMVFKTDTYIRP